MYSNISFNGNYLDSYIFSTNYTPMCTNISSLSDAQIIILPESHCSENDQIRNAWIINTLYRKGDVVLVESPNDEPQTFHQINKVSRKITVRGWDCPESDEAIHIAKEPFYELTEKLLRVEGFEKEHRLMLLEAIENGPCKTDDSFKRQFVSLLNAVNNVTPNVKKQLLLRHIRTWHEQNGELGDVLESTFGKRQKSLINKNQEFCEPQNRVFIFAGAAHVLSKADDKQFIKSGVKLFQDSLKRKKFIIFDYGRAPTLLLRANVKLCQTMFSIKKTVTKICEHVSKIFSTLALYFQS